MGEEAIEQQEEGALDFYSASIGRPARVAKVLTDVGESDSDDEERLKKHPFRMVCAAGSFQPALPPPSLLLTSGSNPRSFTRVLT